MQINNLKSSLVWYTAEKIGAILYIFYSNAILARMLGPSEYGSFVYVLNIALLLSFVINLGLDNIATREISMGESASEVICSLALLRLAGFMIFLPFFIFFTRGEGFLGFNVLTVVILYHFFRMFYIFRIVSECNSESKSVSQAYLYSRLIAILLLTILEKISVSYVFFYLVLEAGLTSLLLYRISRINIVEIFKRSTVLRALAYLRESVPVTAGLALSGIFMQSDIILIKSILTEHSAGIYSAAMSFILPASFLPNIVMTIFMPSLVRQFKVGGEIYLSSVKAISQLLVIFGLIYFIFLFAAGSYLLVMVYGVKYTESADLLKILPLTTLFSFPAFLYSRVLVIERKSDIEIIKSITAAFFSLTLNYFLLRHVGLMGAAIACVISYALADLFCYALFPKTRHIFIIAIKSLFLANLSAAYLFMIMVFKNAKRTD